MWLTAGVAAALLHSEATAQSSLANVDLTITSGFLAGDDSTVHDEQNPIGCGLGEIALCLRATIKS